MAGEPLARRSRLTPLLLVSIAVLIGAVVCTRVFLPDRLWVDARLYSVLDGLAANITILLAVLLLLSSGLRPTEHGTPWIPSALLALGIPLELKSFTENMAASIWLEVLSVFASGAFGSLVWVPRLRTRHPLLVALGATTLVLALGILLLSGLAEALPSPLRGRQLSLTAARFVEAGAFLHLAVTVWCVRAYRRTPNAECLLYTVLFGLSAFGALIHPFTRVWGSTWWLVQVVQSFPAWVALFYIFDTFRESQKALLKAHRELERFTGVVSHDLKSPLSTVSLLLGLVRRRLGPSADPSVGEPLERAVALTNRMGRLVEDLLLYSRAGDAPLQWEPVDLDKTLAECLEGLTAEIRAAGATVTSDALPTVPGDPTLLRQLLQNLLGNAIKFRGTDPPRIHVGAHRAEQGWELFVRDNGVGFSMDEGDNLFEPFQRLSSGRDRPGSGMGLPFCREVVHRHGGRIWARSSPGNGAVFYFTLPEGSRSDFSEPLHRGGLRPALRPS